MYFQFHPANKNGGRTIRGTGPQSIRKYSVLEEYIMHEGHPRIFRGTDRVKYI